MSSLLLEEWDEIRFIKIIGRVKHVDPDRPKRVRLEGYNNYREFLRIITRHSTSMISNDTQSSSEYSDSQYYWDRLCCIVVKEIKIFFNLDIINFLSLS